MISIIVTAYNVEKYIEECLQSVLNQTYKDFECIVVLDCPTDNTESKVEMFAKADQRIKIMKNKENVGPGLSRRYGLGHAYGEYSLLLDGDDYLEPTFIEDLYKKAIETDADIVSGGITVLQENGEKKTTLYGECIIEGNEKVTKFWGENIVFMNNKLIRNTLHQKIQYCHRRYIEDTPVIIPQLWLANKVAYVDNPGYIYRMNPSSLTHTSNMFKDIIFKGLCWCDLMDFFSLHDPTMFKAIDIKGYIINTIRALNDLTITHDMVNEYPMEWAEFTYRLLNNIYITNIGFKKRPKLQKITEVSKSPFE